jgi:hypothetical protein
MADTHTDSDDLLEQWLAAGQQLLTARKGTKREAELEGRLEKLEGLLADRPAAERREALEDLSDDELELLREYRAGNLKPAADEPSGEPDGDDIQDVTPKRTRPGRKAGRPYSWTVGDDGEVVRLDIPSIFHGEDEPDEVEIPDADEADDPPAADVA